MSFVEKGLLLKLPSGEIRQKLRKAGWAEEQINYAMSEAAKVPGEKPKKTPGEKPKGRLFSFSLKKKN